MVVIFSLLLVHRECVAFLPCVLFTHDGLNSDTRAHSMPLPQGSSYSCSDISKWKVWQLKENCPPFPSRFHQLLPFPLVLPSDMSSRCPSRDLHISGPPQSRLVEAGRQGSVITQTLCPTHLPASGCHQMSSSSLPWNRLFRARLFSQLLVLDSHAYSF